LSTTKTRAKKEAYLNIVETDVEAGMTYEGDARVPLQVMQLCAMDRSLSEAAAAYYSPYKLKPSMEGREAHSTSCSFGMMAFLARLRETMSPCAKIITYRLDPKFHSAAHALQVADGLEKSKGASGALAAKKIRQYVETVRQKYVLIDTIANQWCPGVWTAAKATPGATCAAPRTMSWTEEGAKLAKTREAASGGRKGGRGRGGRKRGGRQPKDGRGFQQAGNQGLMNELDALLAELDEEDLRAESLVSSEDPDDASKGLKDSRGKPIKIALNEDSCEAFEDETLASRLENAPEAPPDFFRDAALAED